MEKDINKIIKIFPTYEEIYQEYINETIENLKKYGEIKLYGKILHYLTKPSFSYNCSVYKKTKLNPFNQNVIFNF